MNNQVIRELKFYGAGVAVFAILLVHMFYTLWTNEAWLLFHAVADATFLPDGATGTKAIILFAAGIYFGLLFLYSLDHRKRYRGLLLFFGSGIIVLGMAAFGFGLPNFSPTPLNIGSLVTGVIVGLLSEGIPLEGSKLTGQFHNIDWLVTFGFKPKNSISAIGSNTQNRFRWGPARDRDTGGLIEFEIATTVLQAYTFAIIGIGAILNLYVARQSLGILQIGHLAGSAAFVYFLINLLDIDIKTDPDPPKPDTGISDTDYSDSEEDDKHSIEVIGPKMSAKTYFQLGLYTEATKHDLKFLEVGYRNEAMRKLFYQHLDCLKEQLRYRDFVNWSINSNPQENVRIYRFDVERQGVKQKDIQFGMTDYAGELLEDISIAVAGRSDGGEQPEETNETDDPGIMIDDEGETETARKDIEKGVFEDETTENLHEDLEAEPPGETENPTAAGPSDHTGEVKNGSSVESEADTPSWATSDTDSGGSKSTTSEPKQSDDEIDKISDQQSSGDENTSNDVEITDIDEEKTQDNYEKETTSSGEEKTKKDPNDERQNVIDSVAKNIGNADSLIFVLDGHRLVGGQPGGEGSGSLEAQAMSRIRDAIDPDNAIPVVTKADYLIKDFVVDELDCELDDVSSTDDIKTENLPTDDHLWSEFRTYLTERVKNHPEIRPEWGMFGDRKVLPVYYHTEERTVRDEEPLDLDYEFMSTKVGVGDVILPKTDDKDELMQEGFAAVLDEIAREA